MKLHSEWKDTHTHTEHVRCYCHFTSTQVYALSSDNHQLSLPTVLCTVTFVRTEVNKSYDTYT